MQPVITEQVFGETLRSLRGEARFTVDEFFIEKRGGQGDFAIRKPNTDRASAVEPNDATIHVERVRQTKRGSPDKWRKLVSGFA